jgi:hypothetical protein
MRTLPYLFLVAAAGLSLATFLTSETLAAGAIYIPCVHSN